MFCNVMIYPLNSHHNGDCMSCYVLQTCNLNIIFDKVIWKYPVICVNCWTVINFDAVSDKLENVC